ncbi:conserved hypothetical protein [Frankia sp. Hr75.2]|nr:conserved hypothetical protein [Frankia sp. Hr75.2]
MTEAPYVRQQRFVNDVSLETYLNLAQPHGSLVDLPY